MSKKLVSAGLAALIVSGSAIGAATPAQAGHWHHHHWHHGPHWGAAAAVGALGLATGAAIAASGYPYYGGCYFTRQPVTDGWGNFLGYQRVRVCY